MFKHPVMWILALVCTVAAFTATTLYQKRSDSLYRQTRDFPEILYLVHRAYVDEVAMSDLMPGAFQGALEKVDENASYIPPGVEPASLDPQVFQGTGMTLVKKDGFAFVVAVGPASPAAQAGLKSGTYLRTIDGLETPQMSSFEVRRHLATEKGPFQLEVFQKGGGKDVELTIEPGKFKPPSITYTRQADGVHLFQVPHFYKGFARDLKRSLTKLEGSSAQIVLDFRDNAAGDESHLLAMAGLFLPKGPLGSWVDAKGQETTILNPKEGVFNQFPLYLLVNGATSKSAEAFCAMAQDIGHATIVGESSLGLTGSYEVIPLDSGGFVELETRKLTLTSGRTLTRAGISPDEPVGDDEEPGESAVWLSQALEKVRTKNLKKAS